MNTNQIQHQPAAPRRTAFTLLEMLVVLVIIAIIAGLALPHIRGNSESVAINAACRQLVADFSYARQRAISQRSTVAVVFVSPEILGTDLLGGNLSANEKAEVRRLQGGVYTHYALYQYRRVGEQPGTRETDGYITEWKSLPDKTFIDPDEFNGNSTFFKYSSSNSKPKFRFPFSSSPPLSFRFNGLPYVAFDHEGRCITVDRDETGAGSVVTIPYELNVARGSIFVSRDANGVVNTITDYDVTEVPPANATNNVIYINGLTGRAKRLETRLQ